MEQGQAFCIIAGDEKVLKLIERIWRIQLNIESLKRVFVALKRVWDEFQKQEDQRDSLFLEALTFYSVVEYTKCFNSDFSDKLDSNVFSDALPDNASPSDLSEREFHNLVMNYRNMHLAHAGRLLKVSETGGIKLANGDFGIGAIVATRSYREEFYFYSGLNALAVKALSEAQRRALAAQQKLMDLIRNGEAKITDEILNIIPIPESLTPREMWGLPPRTRS